MVHLRVTRWIPAVALVVMAMVLLVPGTAGAEPQVATEQCPPGPSWIEPFSPGSASVAGAVHPDRVHGVVGTDGVVAFTERLTHDFGAAPQPAAATRALALRQHCTEGWDQVYPLGEVTVTDQSGAPVDVSVEEDGDLTLLRIGDPAQEVQGVQVYELRYEVAGLFLDQESQQVLRWRPVGYGGDVTLRDLDIAYTLPIPAKDPVCWAGPDQGDRRCTRVGHAGADATVFQDLLAPGEGLRTTVFMQGHPVTASVMVERVPWSLGRALPLTVPGVLVALASLLAVGTVLALLGFRPWPRHTTARRTGPPAGVGPAQLAVLLDQRVSSRAIDAAQGGPGAPQAGERTRDEVAAALERDVVAQGWFSRPPHVALRRWRIGGLIALLAAIAALVALAATAAATRSPVAWAAVPPVLGALVVVVGPAWFRHRTKAGEALAEQGRAYAAFLADPRAPLARQRAEPGTYAAGTPYAAALGLSERWARTFAGSGAGGATTPSPA